MNAFKKKSRTARDGLGLRVFGCAQGMIYPFFSSQPKGVLSPLCLQGDRRQAAMNMSTGAADTGQVLLFCCLCSSLIEKTDLESKTRSAFFVLFLSLRSHIPFF